MNRDEEDALAVKLTGFTVEEMQAVSPVRRGPCRDCPFRDDGAPGYLGGFSALETHAAAMSEVDFICHTTRGEDKVKHRSCAGRLLYASKVCKVFSNPKLEAARQKILEGNSLENILGFNFIEYHKYGVVYAVREGGDDNGSE